MTKVLYFRKKLENEGFKVPRKWPSFKICFGLWASFGLEWAKRLLFKENRRKGENGSWLLHEVSRGKCVVP